jgi:hypothetical protein
MQFLFVEQRYPVRKNQHKEDPLPQESNPEPSFHDLICWRFQPRESTEVVEGGVSPLTVARV